MSTDFQVPGISSEQVDDNKGVFTIEPLDKGFGYTFGSSLRRVLLSSLGGAAITSVRIEDVSHEFSNIPGVKEDVTDVVLNLKDLVVRMHTESDAVEAPIVVGLSLCDRRRTAIVYEERPGRVVGAFRARVDRVGGQTTVAYAASL